jgi:large subunit ribosomal protein L4e
MVGVYSGLDGKSVAQVRLPAVFESPIRLDVVRHVHRDINKNHRQAYAVFFEAGHQTSAESWGTGRAVARIPRVAGGGTHRAGQGAFGNMCRGGRMFAPTKTYRRWHRKVNKNQRRFAIVSALAASSSTALVMARGHRIEKVSEIPLVVSNETISEIAKTSTAVKLLKTINAFPDVEKVKDSRKLRSGSGKSRNRRHTQRKGPLIIYDTKSPLIRAFRNIPGIELCSVRRLNLLQLAPGGHLGRFVIWTKGAFEKLNQLYGTYKKPSELKIGFRLPQAKLTNSDLGRIINSQEIQSHLRNKIKQKKYTVHKKNPLRNLGVMIKLNPYAKTLRRRELLRAEVASKKRKAFLKRIAEKQPKVKKFNVSTKKKEGKNVHKRVKMNKHKRKFVNILRSNK